MSILNDIDAYFNAVNNLNDRLDALIKADITPEQREMCFEAKLALMDNDSERFLEILQEMNFAFLCRMYL